MIILKTPVIAYASDYPPEDGGAFERQTLAVATQAVDPWQEGRALSRGVSRVSLYYRNDRWWIASWSSQNETDEMLPAKYAPESDPE